ncbi:type II toxin-antitoxin system RelE/ParE family toxin [Candidatus Undinarchaeota archaeon]
MSFRVVFDRRASNYLEKLEKTTKSRIKSKLTELKNNPKFGERLKYSDLWKLRIGEYRAIYEIKGEKKKVIILFIGHRENVYDDFSRIF